MPGSNQEAWQNSTLSIIHLGLCPMGNIKLKGGGRNWLISCLAEAWLELSWERCSLVPSSLAAFIFCLRKLRN